MRWWVVELDGLHVDGPDGHRLGHRGLLSLPGVQAGPQKATKGAKVSKGAVLVKIPHIAKSLVEEENHMQIRVM